MMMRLALAGILIALAAPAAAADAPLGRLFFTPSQRASLDVARSHRTRATVATERTDEDVQPVPQTITYGGMVRRSDGRTTVWLNDHAIDEQKAASGSTIIRRVRPDGAVTLEVPQSSRSVDLKVGQSVEVLSGSIGEGYRQRPAAGGAKPTGEEAQDSGAAKSTMEKGTTRGDGDGRRLEPRKRATAQQNRAPTTDSR